MANVQQEKRNICIGSSTLALLVFASTIVYMFFEAMPIIWYHNERSQQGDADLTFMAKGGGFMNNAE